MGLLRKIRTTGRVAEPAPPRPEGEVLEKARELGGSVQVRCVDAGSCNGCEIEIAAAFNPVYDAERYGARLVASPRHADVALVTGPVTRGPMAVLAPPPEPGSGPRTGVGLVEGWRGTIATRVELARDGPLARVKPVDPSFFNWPALPVALADTIVPDFPLTNRSFNLSYAGNDL